MSHNKFKVAGQVPDSNGEITVSVEHLNDVNLSTVQANQILQYSSGNWINADSSTLSGGTVLLIGDGSSTNYPTGASLGYNDKIHFYNTIYNGINATITNSSGWIDEITLPAGSYHCNAVVGLEFSSSTGVATYRWSSGTGGNFFGTQGNVKQDTDTIGSSCSGYISSTSNIIVSVRFHSNPSGLQSAQATRHAEYGYIEIRKLG